MKFAVDFDGTLVADDHYPKIGEWFPGAQNFLRDLLVIGDVTIHTCRTSDLYYGSSRHRPDQERWADEDALVKALDINGLHQVTIFTERGKPAADYYIDNKAPFFPFLADGKTPDYKAILNEIIGYEEAKPKAWFQGGPGEVRQFPTGATRNVDVTKIDPEAALSPLVLRRYCEFKRDHRKQADGSVRPDDGWQKGIPLDSYMKSLQRHNLDAWLLHRGQEGVYSQDMEETLCAMIFNVSGFLHELLAAKTKKEAA